MSKKDFIALADRIRPFVLMYDDYAQTGETDRIVGALADFCAAQNPRFNRKRWLDYLHGLCGPSGGRIAA